MIVNGGETVTLDTRGLSPADRECLRFRHRLTIEVAMHNPAYRRLVQAFDAQRTVAVGADTDRSLLVRVVGIHRDLDRFVAVVELAEIS